MCLRLGPAGIHQKVVQVILNFVVVTSTKNVVVIAHLYEVNVKFEENQVSSTSLKRFGLASSSGSKCSKTPHLVRRCILPLEHRTYRQGQRVS